MSLGKGAAKAGELGGGMPQERRRPEAAGSLTITRYSQGASARHHAEDLVLRPAARLSGAEACGWASHVLRDVETRRIGEGLPYRGLGQPRSVL